MIRLDLTGHQFMRALPQGRRRLLRDLRRPVEGRLPRPVGGPAQEGKLPRALPDSQRAGCVQVGGEAGSNLIIILIHLIHLIIAIQMMMIISGRKYRIKLSRDPDPVKRV